MQPGFLGLHGPRLEQKNAGDDLQAVGDAVLHLLQQHLLLPEQLVLFALGVARSVTSSIASSSAESGVGFVEHLARIQQHTRRPTDGNSCSTS